MWDPGRVRQKSKRTSVTLGFFLTSPATCLPARPYSEFERALRWDDVRKSEVANRASASTSDSHDRLRTTSEGERVAMGMEGRRKRPVSNSRGVGCGWGVRKEWVRRPARHC